MKREEVEVCPHCDGEIVLQWNVEQDGYQIKCPYCGEKIMLCDACRHSDDNLNMICDWSEEYGCFRKQPSLLQSIRTEIDAIYDREGGHSYEEVIEEIARTHGGEIIETTHDFLKKKGMSESLLYLFPNVPCSALINKNGYQYMITVNNQNRVVANKMEDQQMVISKMTPNEIAKYLLNLHAGQIVEFAITQNEITDEPETWFFATIMEFPQYDSKFLLVDYCGGLQSIAYPISKEEELEDIKNSFNSWMSSDCRERHGEGPDKNAEGQYVVYVDVTKKIQ